MKLVLASKNQHKLLEMEHILRDLGLEVVLESQVGVDVDVEETGTTFLENAALKARAVMEASGMAAIADDSGLMVDALDGAPGVYSARYCGRHGDDEANNDKLLAALSGVEEGSRGAKFVSAVCFYLPGGRQLTVLGECPGRVGFARAGTNGFGYDPLFIPDEVGLPGGGKAPNAEGRSYAQLEDWEKDAISHRGVAMAKLDKELPAFLAAGEGAGAPITAIEGTLGFERNQKRDGDRLTRALR